MTNSNRVIHFEIQADDIERAKTFYKKVFNWKMDKMEKKDDPSMMASGDDMDYWMIMTGPDSTPGINGGMYERSNNSNKLYTYDCTISVSDIDKAIEAVKANGGAIRREKMKIPDVGWFAGATDTEGNMFGLMQSVMS